MPAQTTAKMVIASAKRLIEVRHFWRSRKRIAEISVPAWPMPTQNTKLVMSHAQPTVVLRPQTPTPVMIRWAIIAKSISASDPVNAIAMYQARGGRGRSDQSADGVGDAGEVVTAQDQVLGPGRVERGVVGGLARHHA